MLGILLLLYFMLGNVLLGILLLKNELALGCKAAEPPEDF